MNNPKATVRLARVLMDGAWHDGAELSQRVGWRFGSAVQRLRQGDLGLPLGIEREHVRGSHHRYRAVGWPPAFIEALLGDMAAEAQDAPGT